MLVEGCSQCHPPSPGALSSCWPWFSQSHDYDTHMHCGRIVSECPFFVLSPFFLFPFVFVFVCPAPFPLVPLCCRVGGASCIFPRRWLIKNASTPHNKIFGCTTASSTTMQAYHDHRNARTRDSTGQLRPATKKSQLCRPGEPSGRPTRCHQRFAAAASNRRGPPSIWHPPSLCDPP